MHELYVLRRLLATGAALVLVVGCGIAAQSPTTGGGPTVAPSATTAIGQPTPSAPSSPGATDPGASSSPDATGSPGATVVPPASIPPISGQVTWGNWPAYIDIDEETGAYPTLDAFTAQTGIQVTYQEAINDNSEFFGRIQPDLAAGNPTGFDIISPSDWMVARLIRLGYLQPLNKSFLPNFEANALDVFRDPWYDPGNQYSIPWQAGIVGIGYNPTLTGREITTFDDLLDPAFAGRVGLFSEMIDTMSMALLSNGVNPEDATLEDVQAAHDKLLTAAQAGQFRNFYGNDYYDALAVGDLALTMAWSGDVSQMQLYDNPDVRFVVPESGGMLFVDNMVIPNAAEHVGDAYALMDYWYTLEAAVPLTEYIGYFSPVTGVSEQVAIDAAAERAADHPIRADRLDQIARDSFPSEELLQNVFNYKILSEEEERQWNDLFNEIVTG
jgi:spermidine/putrescine transport system substrate-binding protein